MPSIAAFVKEGRLKLIAVNTEKRSALAPQIPAVSEFVPGFEAGSPRVHLKHGIAAAVAAVVVFAAGWYAGRARA